MNETQNTETFQTTWFYNILIHLKALKTRLNVKLFTCRQSLYIWVDVSVEVVDQWRTTEAEESPKFSYFTTPSSSSSSCFTCQTQNKQTLTESLETNFDIILTLKLQFLSPLTVWSSDGLWFPGKSTTEEDLSSERSVCVNECEHMLVWIFSPEALKRRTVIRVIRRSSTTRRTNMM